VALDLFSIEKQYWLFSPRASTLYASDPALEYVRRQSQPGRVLAEQLVPGPRDVMLSYDGPMVEGIRLATGYHGNEIGRYERLCGAEPGSSFCEPRIIFSPMFWRHENVRYLYTNADTIAIGQIFPIKLPKLVGPVRDAAGNNVYLYRLPGENPPAWLAPVFVKAPEDQIYAAVLNPQFDPTRVAVLDTDSRIPAQQIQAPPAPLEIAVQVTRYAPGDIQLQLPSSPPAGTALIVSENYFPGWSASVDGKPALTDRVQYNLIGVQLPANAKQITLRFDDAAYERGKLITIIATALALALVAASFAVPGLRQQAA